MRTRFVGIVLIFSLQLSAQDEKAPYYIQQAPVQQMALNCYERNLEEGLAAQRRGDCRLALRWFRDAESCPEVLLDNGRLEELKALIAQCEQKKTTVSATPQAAARTLATAAPELRSEKSPGAAHRRFSPSKAFLLYDKPDCFDVTVREAARAFAGGYWDDAAALYRAAKNCTDADQNDRALANKRIEDCRVASQNELRRQEQEAVRQGRHALAANRANDARQLLRESDRSLAYRLADFANEYIAPEDNDACRQTMFEALYYAPPRYAPMAEDRALIPFCYELGDNLDNGLQVRFLGRNGTSRICAFAPSRHLLFQWDATTFEPLAPVPLEDTTLTFFDVVPDGRTLLFVSRDAYLFWRSPREIFRLPAKQVSHYCFSPDGSTFYYMDAAERQIYDLNLRDAFATRKGFSQRAAPLPTGIPVDYDMLQISAGNRQIWVGYPERIVSYVRSNGQWHQEQEYALPDVPASGYLWLDPLAQTAVLVQDTAAIAFHIAGQGDSIAKEEIRLAGKVMAVSPGSRYFATYQIDLFQDKGKVSIFSIADGSLQFRAMVPAGQQHLQLNAGVFSPDNRLFATVTNGGKLHIWELTGGINQRITTLGEYPFIAQSIDGANLFVWRNDSILLVSENDPNRIRQATAAPEGVLPFLLAEKNWVAYRLNADSVVLTDRLGRRRHIVSSPPGDISEIVGGFSSDEQHFACLWGGDSVAIYDLNDGHRIAARGFGGAINQIQYVPQTGEVLVVHWVDSDNQVSDQTVVKLWDPVAGPDVRSRTVRLQDYSTLKVALSERQGYIAFTNGIDIRVFRQNDLLNEVVRISQNNNQIINALAFHPAGNMLAAGYADGSVVFWDIATGQVRFSWARPQVEGVDLSSIARMRFIDGGRRLQILFWENVLLTRDLEVSLIRTGVQTDFRKLVSFQPGQIREYNLEQALDYPNNFTRLAASGDLPLIRSFFDYFRETALNSNNIQRVANSCKRASILYGQLDDAARNVLRPILLEMFEDYHWKLLLRNQIDEARKVVDDMQRDFGNSAATILASAHTALLRDNQREAARQYAEWALLSADIAWNNGFINRLSLDSLQNKITQLLAYDLILPDQLNCICGLFGGFPSFEQLCADFSEDSATPLLDAETRLRWRILKQLNSSQTLKNNRQRVENLESALEDTRGLRNQNPAVYQQTLENVVLALQQAYANLGNFEQKSHLAPGYYLQAIRLLNTYGAFHAPGREQARLFNLSNNYLQLSGIYLDQDSLAAAENASRQGLSEANRLLRIVPDSAVQQRYRDDLNGPLQVMLGRIYLLRGDANAAKQAFEQAQNDRTEGIHRLYFGHAALLAGKLDEASLEYRNIFDEATLGECLFDIEQMAAHLPAQKMRLTKYLYQLRNDRLQNRQQMVPEAADFYWAYDKALRLGVQGQWDSARAYSDSASVSARRVIKQSGSLETWVNNWLDAQLSESYYLLLCPPAGEDNLSKCIALSMEAEAYFDTTRLQTYYAGRNLFKTNLAHAYWLRNRDNDREKAIEKYEAFLANTLEPYDPWELLLKDFRDLIHAGVSWPGLQELIRQIRPAKAKMTPGDWEALGLPAESER